MTARLRASLLLAFLLIAGTLAIELNHPPTPLPLSAPPDEFSAYRALEHLKQFARKPHPMGSAEHDRVRDYLIDQLRALGLSPEIQRATGVTGKFSAAGNVENIVARQNGTRPGTPALMLAAHYDSVPAAPGNGDDGAGVAAILETLRALHTQPPLQNDLIVLFTDGEEDGLLGASAFAAEHPWAKDVRLPSISRAAAMPAFLRCLRPAPQTAASSGNSPPRPRIHSAPRSPTKSTSTCPTTPT